MGCPKLHEGWRFVSAEPADVGESPFLFTSEYLDSEAGLVYYGYRYYDADMGRWLNRDPIGEVGGSNIYGFVQNDGINYWDRLGLIAWSHVKYCVITTPVTRMIYCARAYKLSQSIRSKHKKRYGSREDNSVMNAIYHCVWQCKIAASHCGPRRCKRIGDDHENHPGNPADNKRMNLYNNAIGRSVSKPGMAWTRCYANCEAKAKSGALWWFKASKMSKSWNQTAKNIIGNNVPQNPATGWVTPLPEPTIVPPNPMPPKPKIQHL